MTSLNFGALSGKGIVAVLVIAGIALVYLGQNSAGTVAIWAGVFIGIALGALGVVGVVKRLTRF